MNLLKNIYANKSAVVNNCEINDLISIMENDHGVSVTNNADRTLSVKFKKTDDLKSICESSISKWVNHIKLSCSINYLYNIFPLSNNSLNAIIRI